MSLLQKKKTWYGDVGNLGRFDEGVSALSSGPMTLPPENHTPILSPPPTSIVAVKHSQGHLIVLDKLFVWKVL
jgi:hypothetical protein